jgi:thiamine-monophosphate kinase
MDEFALIDAVVAALGDAIRGPGIVLGPGDDCAIAVLPPGTELVTTVDTLVAGVHFPADAPGAWVGHRALGVCVSDLAAMGATPLHAVLSVTLEDTQQEWLVNLARGLGDAAREMGIAVVGGNLARGPLNVAIAAHGFVPRGQALRRAGAHPGDHVFVSGRVGGAGLALARLDEPPPAIEHLRAIPPDHPDHPLRRYWLPSPRLVLGISLRGIASAAIDVSDGLVADLRHLCVASGVGACLVAERIPLAAGARLETALGAGDDYELLFTVPPASLGALDELGADVTEIGEITSAHEVISTRAGRPIPLDHGGFLHFR